MTGQTKLIGLLGGMSWESSALYYRLLNQSAQRRLGGHNNARSVLFTLNYEELNALASAGRWDGIGERVGAAARQVEAAGADFVMITAVTGHAVASQVEACIGVPLLHVADPTGDAIKAAGFSKVGLLGTRFTMEMGFLAGRLAERHGLDVIVPPARTRAELHRIVVDELTLGRTEIASKHFLLEAARELAGQGAQAIVVGCTELPLLAEMTDYPIPAFDVVQLHVEEAMTRALCPAR
jgi:aspartate racemase